MMNGLDTPFAGKDSADRGRREYRFSLPQELLPGVLAGFAGLWLMDEGITGPGMLVWLLLLDGCALWLLRNNPRIRRWLLLWAGTSLVGWGMLSLWSTPVLVPFMTLVLLASAVQFTLQCAGQGFNGNDFIRQAQGLATFLLRTLVGMFRVLGDIEWPSARGNRVLHAVIRGLLITLPLLVLFGSLFWEADQRFSLLVDDLGSLLSPEGMIRLVRVLVISWFTCGVLTLITRLPSAFRPVTLPRMLGETEALIILGALCVLFTVFVFLQLEYLFGGEESLQALGITVADYARRGFFELVWVTGLTLLVLGVLGHFAEAPRAFRVGGLTLLALTAIILASALQRLGLYVETFGLTLQRLVALGIVAWLGWAMLLTAFRTSGRIRVLVPGLLAGGIVMALLFSLAGPARVVAVVNMDRALARDELPDLYYLSRLGDDAVPTVLEGFTAVSAMQQCVFVDDYFRPMLAGRPSKRHWRLWNWSRARVAALRDELDLPTGNPPEWAALDAATVAELARRLADCPLPITDTGYNRLPSLLPSPAQ